MHTFWSSYSRASSKLLEAAVSSVLRACISGSWCSSAVLHATCSFLPSSPLSSTSSSHPSAFIHLLSTSCCSLISILPTCLSYLCHASVAAQTELCRRAGRAQQDQTSPSVACIYTPRQAEQWDGQSSTRGWRDKMRIMILMPSRKKSIQNGWNLTAVRAAAIPLSFLCCVKEGFWLKRFLPSSICLAGTYLMICPYGSH